MNTPSKQVRAAVLAATVLTFAAALVRYEGPALGYWDTYITTPAMMMSGHTVDFVLHDGSAAWGEVSLRGVLPADLVDHDGFGIATKDQRIGPAISAALPFVGFGLLGFRLLFAASVALIVPLSVLLARAALPAVDWALGDDDTATAPWRVELAGLVGGVLLACNPYVVSVDRLNANVFVLPLMLAVLGLILRPATGQRVPVVATGLLFGVLAGIRNEAVCFVPAICVATLWPSADGAPLARRFGRLVSVGALTVVAMLPVFHWKAFALGHPLMHPSQYAHFQGFRPEFEHSLFGWTFSFNGLFNWPLHDKLVRTPHFGYPTWLLFPLVTARAFGTAGVAWLAYGAWVLLRGGARGRFVLAVAVVWAAPVLLLFLPQENWEEVKMTFMLLAWAPLALFGASTAFALLERPFPTRQLLRVAMLSLVVFAGVKALGQVEAPADQRWYVRFPNADAAKNPDAQEGLAETERNDWRYFQSYETAEEIRRERDKLRAARPFPARYLPVSWDVPEALGEIRGEAWRRDLTVLEIWGYIYGTRRWPKGVPMPVS